MTRALALFELLLFASAPTIMRSNTWLEAICGMPVQWISTSTPARLLFVDLVHRLLATSFGKRIITRCRSIGHDGELISLLEALQSRSGVVSTVGNHLVLVGTVAGSALVRRHVDSIVPAHKSVEMSA